MLRLRRSCVLSPGPRSGHASGGTTIHDSWEEIGVGVGVLPVLLPLVPVAAAMGFSTTPNLKLKLKLKLQLEPRPRIGTSRRLVRLRCALSSEPPVVCILTVIILS
jgi:hypothetical protein